MGVIILKSEPHIPLFLGLFVTIMIALWQGFSWLTIEEGIVESIAKAVPALIILLIIGMLIGAWIGSGIVPVLIYYSFQLLEAKWFLPIVFLLTSVMSVLTGSAWTTIGTLGVAAMGSGQALGVDMPIVAGAVASGAFLGDKMSPLSDTTNLAAQMVGVNVYSHIKHMLYSTVPSFVISLVLYTVIGFMYINDQASLGTDITAYQEALGEAFNITPLLLIPALFVIIIIILKIPAIPGLFLGVLLGGASQFYFQQGDLEQIINTLYYGFSTNTGWDFLDDLLSRGGLESMYSTVALAIITLALGGVMYKCNMLQSLVLKIKQLISSRGNLILTTLGTSFLINILTANQYLALILPEQMYDESYKKLGMHPKNLSRVVESGGTLTAPLIPWNTSGIFILSVLSISPLKYAPFAFLCWLTPLIDAFYGYANITIEDIDW